MKITTEPHSYVAIDYSLTLDSGEEVDKTEPDKPLSFITGLGQVIPGLEKQLLGLEAGNAKKIIVEAEDAFGPVNQELIQEIPLSNFPDKQKVEPGMSFQAQGPSGPLMLKIQSVNDDTATVNLNHPMAGERLNFDVKVLEVRESTAAELAAANSCGCGPGVECTPHHQSSCGPSSGCGCG